MPSLWLSTIRIASRYREGYRRIFSIGEIEHNKTLQWFFGAMLFFFYVTFYQWISSPLLTTENHTVCWPYFQECNDLHFLSYFPYGYSQTTFYMALFALMLGVVYFMYRKDWVIAHALMLPLFTWKIVASFLLSWSISGVYDYYHLVLTAVLLFAAHKEYFAKLLFVMLYFLSSTIKFYPTWVLGNYFTALQLGLPLFPNSLTAIITNSVILEQVVGCWFLLSKRPAVQRLTLLYFIAFHLYGGILVLYNYSSITLPVLLILFGPMYRHQLPPIRKTALAGWGIVLFIILFQTPVHFISGDEKMTMEGYRYGVWMFDANHQCISTYDVYYKQGAQNVSTSTFAALPGAGCGRKVCVTQSETTVDNGGLVRHYRVESPRGELRCSPYTAWQSYLTLCEANVTRVAFTYDHSINGGPFYRIVNVPDMCHLTYKAFGHNDWISEPPEAPAVGYPVTNRYF